MSDNLREEALAHFGVKGMKWGVHNRGNDGGSAGSTRADKKWGKKAAKFSTFTKSYNAAAQRMNDVEIARINNKPAYKKADFTNDSPLRRKYYKEFNDTFERVVNEEASRIMGTNPSGTKRLQYHATPEGQIQFKFEDVKHAEDDAVFIGRTDAQGRIISIDLSDDSLAQSEEFITQGDEVLQHFGVKGMKWGHRKQKSLDRMHRIASGKASVGDTLRFSANVTIPELVKNKGSLKRIAAGRAVILEAQKKRIESGNSTAIDKLDRALNTPVIDLIRGR